MIGYPSSIFLGEVLQPVLVGCPDKPPQLIRVAETGLSLGTIEFVRRGLGVGWLPYSMAEPDLRSDTLVSLGHFLPEIELDVLLLRLKRDLLSKAQEFWAAMQSSHLSNAPIAKCSRLPLRAPPRAQCPRVPA